MQILMVIMVLLRFFFASANCSDENVGAKMLQKILFVGVNLLQINNITHYYTIF